MTVLVCTLTNWKQPQHNASSLSLSASLSLCLTLTLLHCGHWKPIEIALQPSLIKLQLCHKPHMKSTRGEESSGDARQVETRLVSSRVFRLVRKSCPIGHTHTAYGREADLGKSVKLSVIRALCLGQHLPVKVFIPNVGWKRQRIPPSQCGLRRTICATFSVNKNVKLISSA